MTLDRSISRWAQGFRKLRDLSGQVPRAAARAFPELGPSAPAVLVNSFPKSGTHLLYQIAQGLPHVRTFGTFWASTPSWPFRERSESVMLRRIGRVAARELVRGHLFYFKSIEEELARQRIVHLFIVRDLRDVCISEAYYLTYMNRIHVMHRHFARLPNMESRIELAMCGMAETVVAYPDIGRRFERYAGWLSSPNVLTVRFEDLRDGNCEREVFRIVRFAQERGVWKGYPTEELVKACASAVAPERSVTFRRGTVGSWKTEFTEEQKNRFKLLAGDVLIRLGYESSLEW